MTFAVGSKVQYLWREEEAAGTVTRILRNAVVVAFDAPVPAVPFVAAREAVLRPVEDVTTEEVDDFEILVVDGVETKRPVKRQVERRTKRLEVVEPAVPEQRAVPGWPGLYTLDVTFLKGDSTTLLDLPLDGLRRIVCAEGEVFAP